MRRIDYYIFGYDELRFNRDDMGKVLTAFLRSGIRTTAKSEDTLIIFHYQLEEAKRIFESCKINYTIAREHRVFKLGNSIGRTIVIASAWIFTIIMVVLLSNMVWCVEVDGNEKVGDNSIISDLDRCGLSIGNMWRDMDLGEIESRFLSIRQDVGWININRVGTVAYVSVIESDSSDADDEDIPRYSNIIATKDCVIEDINVKRGTAVVSVGDVVTAGDVLILGISQNGDSSQFCAAEGEILGRVNDTVNVGVKRKRIEKIPYDISLLSLRIKIFNFSVNIFKKYGNFSNDYDIIEERNKISIFYGRNLPLEVIKEYRIGYEEKSCTASDDELIKEASYLMASLLREKMLAAELNSIKTYGGFTDEGYEMTSELVYSCIVSETVEFFIDEKTGNDMTEKIVLTNSNESTSAIFGAFDSNVKKIENAFGVRVSNRNANTDSGDAIVITGDSDGAEKARKTLEYLKRMSGAGETIGEESVEYVLSLVKDGTEDIPETFANDVICVTNRGKPIKAKTLGQKKYIDIIKKNTIVLGLGPAGTGKTFLAVAMAVEALRNKSVSRIILTRPAVEAGERLGFLPGDLQSKIDPYLRPLYDALFEMLGAENYARHMERGTIEIAPLAYMRGRTLDDSFIILDEAQNTTMEQMKMFLTRLGYNSKAVVTGDLSQTDLPFGKKSGLSVASKILENIDGIGVFRFTDRDVVRHHLVRKIINAYDTYEREVNTKKFTAEPKKRKGSTGNV